MIYLLIILMILIIFILMYLIILLKTAKYDKNDILNILFDNKEKLTKDINEFKSDIKNDNFKYNNHINVTLQSFVSKMAKIDEAQKNIEKLTDETLSLQKILSDKKSRGVFGEQRLEQVLDYIYQDTNLYVRQYKFSTGTIADAVVFLNKNLKKIAIDSKFPLENYNKYLESKQSEYKREFIKNVKKHIDDIATKYIIEGETINQAIMFIPSETIFYDIYTNYEELLNYAYSKRVWICSQTNLMIYISTIQFVNTENIKRENSEYILKELVKFSDEFVRYEKRWNDLSRDFNKLSKDFENLSITSDKINKEFEKIKNLNIKEIEYEKSRDFITSNFSD
ncbi:DNA recombination protein RmuC [Pseudostreptobacillus hongkongensis]|uniref:DNA recombination protein RmuC n=1 Tax=Pseudostreptobacillus hongkongensis TaxID=1162717 RepID=UPI0008328CD7|nr:DNA recombination protein RmuC [Pseudostreptobacillus hongkongensis]